MPRKKHDREDYDHLSRKLRKLERQLKRKRRAHSRSRSRSRKRSRRSRVRSPYSEPSSRDPTPTPLAHAGEYENPTRSTSPVDDVIPCDLPAAVENIPSAVVVETLPSNGRPSTNNEQSTVSNSQLNDLTENDVGLPADQPIDTDLLEILGEDPSSKPEFGQELHKELASRLEHIATSGLDKEMRKQLSDRYLTPSNCTRIAAPQLNPEIKAALPELTLKRDKGIEARQKQLTSAITCLGQAITKQMQSNEKNNELLKLLMDAIRILCDVQHVDSLKRRYFACSSLKKDINDQLVPTKIDKYLFGENLAETLKAAKAVSRSGAEIKVSANFANKNSKKPTQPQPSTSKNLNWRGPGPARRPPPPPPGPSRRPPPAPARRHDNSSSTSRLHSRQTRRR